MEFMQKVKLGIAAVVTIIVLIVVFQNTEPVMAKILFMQIAMPLFAFLLLTLAFGFGMGWLGCMIVRRKKARETEV